VERDISMILNKNISYEKVEGIAKNLKISKLSKIKLFDIFESAKLGTDKRSLAVSFTFSDKEKTLTDKEIDAMMNKIIVSFEKELGAEIRKA
jgi:phenylalanyl-tRNA synthetase beta chain